MRCKFCGSTSIHEDKQHKNFSTGKAVAGAVVFGVVGAAAGFIGKEQNGYRCGACGQFMDTYMDSFTESQINTSIRDAESGRGTQSFNYYKAQYANIQANVPQQTTVLPEQSTGAEYVPSCLPQTTEVTIKRSYRYGRWIPDCPVYVEGIVIKTVGDSDKLSLIAFNQGEKAIQSAYFQVKVFDDTGDEVSSCRCVYQNINIPGGKATGEERALPSDKEFSLGTELAYKIELSCEKVALEGGEVWRMDESTAEISLPIPQPISEDNFPRYKYMYNTWPVWKLSNIKQLYLPYEQGDYRICACGHPLKKGKRCHYCAINEDTFEHAFNQEYLREVQQKSVKERAAKRAEKTITAYESAINSQKQELYKTALSNANSTDVGKVEKAIYQFESLGDFSDSVKKVEYCRTRITELKEKAEADRIRAEEEEEERRIAARKAAEEKRLADEARAKKNKKLAAILIPIAVVGIAFIVVLIKVIIPNINYNSAVKLMNGGKITEAYESFIALNGYKDSSEKATEIYVQYEVEKMKDANVGDTVIFGAYEQDNNTSSGKEDIEWIVLVKEDKKILIISDKALDCQLYNASRTDVTWETCSLRKWMNSIFLNTAFSADEQVLIQSTTVSADRIPHYHCTTSGNDTTDKVFLLSVMETEKYFANDEDRKCVLTAYAIAQGAYTISSRFTKDGAATCMWWLRSPGNNRQDHASYVNYDGSISFGSEVDILDTCVRPALWINLDS